MASTSLADLTPDTRAKAEAFLAAAAAAGFQLSVASTLRSCTDQGTSTGPVKVGDLVLKRAPGCRSWHVFGRAFDVVINNEPTKERYAELGVLGKSFGLEWGGDFATNYDPIHFQYHPGLDIKTLCSDPTDCAGAVARASAGGGTVPPAPVPSPPGSNTGATWLGFAFGLLGGWWVVRRARRRKLQA